MIYDDIFMHEMCVTNFLFLMPEKWYDSISLCKYGKKKLNDGTTTK